MIKHNMIKYAFKKELDIEGKTIKLEQLEGKADLTGVEESYGGIEYGGKAQIIRFVLDGIVFIAAEDPQDGYRSSLRDVTFSFDKKISNTFASVKVKIDFKDNMLKIIDTKSKKIVLKIGTNYSDNYYPYFIGEWNPKNLHVNKKK